MTDLIFLDTETTGLEPEADIWEIAAVRRRGDESTELHMQVLHDVAKAATLDEKFADDRRTRFDGTTAVRQLDAARRINTFMAPSADGTKPTMVGVNPAFDATMVSRLLRRNGFANVPWDYRLIDLPAVTIGGLIAQGRCPDLPAKSDDLAAAAGVPTGTHTRHTAMGDVRWSIDWWDRLVDSASRPPTAVATMTVDAATRVLREYANAADDEGVDIGTMAQLYRRAMAATTTEPAAQNRIRAAGLVLRRAGVE